MGEPADDDSSPSKSPFQEVCLFVDWFANKSPKEQPEYSGELTADFVVLSKTWPATI